LCLLELLQNLVFFSLENEVLANGSFSRAEGIEIDPVFIFDAEVSDFS